MVVIIGIALPVTEILTSRVSSIVYQSFYVYLYTISIIFVIFVYVVHMRARAVFSLIKTYRKYDQIYNMYSAPTTQIDELPTKKSYFKSAYFAIRFFFVDEKTNNDYSVKKRTTHFGSFYLRVGAITFGIGSMVYSGLEFGQYFEMNSKWFMQRCVVYYSNKKMKAKKKK